MPTEQNAAKMAPNPLSGVCEKLIRADENIRNLDREVTGFFEASVYPVIPHRDKETTLKAIEYHRNREIPIRFSVLVGEIAHHLRGILDHLVWLLSSEKARRSHPKWPAFPIYEKRPISKDEITSYERKVEGVGSVTALALIEELQPYNCSDPVDSPLLIIHKMDIIDKHQELVLCYSTGHLEIPVNVIPLHVLKGDRPIEDQLSDFEAEINQYGKVTPQISFRGFGRRPIHPVAPGMMELFNAVREVVLRFESEFT